MNNIKISVYQKIADVAKTVLISSGNPEQSTCMRW